MKTSSDPKLIGIYAGLLSLVEVGLGSLLHGFRIPFAGTFLSLNQSLFLTRITKLNRSNRDSRTLGLQVSNITALLKSLSPAGKKLLPMLAISAQGLLFSMGTLIFGASCVGCLVGSVLSSFWGVFQPLAFLWLVYGTTWNSEQVSQLLDYFSKLLGGALPIESHFIAQAILIFSAIKAMFAMGISWVGWRSNFQEDALFDNSLLKLKLKPIVRSAKPSTSRSSFLGAFQDLLTPFFLIPFALTGVFFWFSNHPKSQWIWIWLRPLAIAYLVFLAVRLFPVSQWIEKMGWKGSAFDIALKFIEGQTTDLGKTNGKEN